MSTEPAKNEIFERKGVEPYSSGRIKECYVCDGKISSDYRGKEDVSKLIRHHVDYGSDGKIIMICPKCHYKIHFTDELPELTPEGGR